LVMKLLNTAGRMPFRNTIKHSYAHCWRCHNPLIYRATNQWFCNLNKNDLLEKTLEEVKKVNFVPAITKSRLTSTISSRNEWCVSRQREWGVPIPAVKCTSCGYAHLTSEFILKVAEQVEKKGIEYWKNSTVESLIKDGLLSSPKCQKCGS